MIEDFVKRMQDRLATRQADYEHELGKGSANSFEDYRKRVGKIEGLKEVATMLDEELDKLKEDDD